MKIGKKRNLQRLWVGIKIFNEIFINVLNFVLLVPVYYVGAGTSYLFWVLSRKKETKGKSYWKDSKKLSENYEDYLKQY